jgi:mevalonate kinase
MKAEHKNISNYVNSVMDELNSLSTDLYEAMMDQENKEVKKIVEAMIPLLKDIQATHTNEII